MAIITVSNTGGLFSSPTTWVGGVIPNQTTQTDSIAFTETSGALIIDGLYYISGINYTNYANIMTFNLNCSLGFTEPSVNTPFINMGTGGYSLVDNSVDGGFDFSSVVSRPVIFTNTLGIANPVRLKIYSIGLPMQITGTWNQTGYLDSGGGIDISTGIFTYTGTLYNGLDYIFSGTAALGSTVNVTTTDVLIDIYIYGAGTININCVNITEAYIEGATLFNLNCVDIVNLGIQQGTFTSNITCVNITNNLEVANNVNLLGIGTLPIPQLLLTVQGTGSGTRTDNLNLGTYTFSNVYYNLYYNLLGDNVNLNLLSVLTCDKLYIRKPITMTSKFLGAFGFVCNEFIIDGGAIGLVTFESGTSYYINNVVDIIFPTTILSSVSGVKSNLILGQNVNQNTIAFLTATDIDSSSGRRVNNFYGTSTNCNNWRDWVDNTLPQANSTF